MPLTLEGKCSWFGGPNDKGVGPKEGLALIPGLARGLDPASFYIACRWNYRQTPKAYLKSITVDVCDPKHPDKVIKCRPVDWGPNKRTGRVADLSPGAIKALGLDTNDIVRVVIPLPGDHSEAIDNLPPPRPPAAPVPLVAPSPIIASASTELIKQTWPLQRDAISFYGNPYAKGWMAANLVEVETPWLLHMGHTPMNHIQIHKRCADSLKRVLAWTWEQAGKSQDKIMALHFDRYSGSYNLRPMRGGQQMSMHGEGAAIDWDDEENQQHSQHHLFTAETPLIHAFMGEAWEWGGLWSPASIDAMHVQAARVHGG